MTDIWECFIMDLIPIESSTKTVQTCFRDCLYAIPDFQRPYSWTEEELGEYWSDVVMARSDFFFGTTVTWLCERIPLFRARFEVIDGQQRLTTSALALSVMRDSLLRLASLKDAPVAEELTNAAESQARVTQGYLVAEDDNGKEYSVLTRPEPMFYEVIQKPSAIPSRAEWGQSARQLGVARDFFEQRTREELDSIVEPIHQLERLKQLRNNILQARLIQVELASEEDASLIFETLNARGAELLASDLVKNLLVRGAGRSAADRRNIAARWTQIIDAVVGPAESLEAADRFIWQSWNSRREAVKMPALYKSIKDLCQNDARRQIEYLGELEQDVSAYSILERVNSEFPVATTRGGAAMSIPEVQDSIRGLNIFRVSVANSAVIALIRKFDTTSLISRANAIRTMRAIESFHFQFNQLTKTGSTGGTRGRYNRFALDLEKAQTKDQVSRAISELELRLRGSLPDPRESKGSFQQLIYAPGMSLNTADLSRGRVDLIRYVLLRLARHLGHVPGAQQANLWTIEHIRPQSLAREGTRSPEFSIGNLALMSAPCNSRLGDLPFSEKREGLAECTMVRDVTLSSWLCDDKLAEITAEQIVKRARALADFAIDEVWAI